jgi:hypothetical protein
LYLVTRPGAAYFFNPIRPGSAVSKESAIDLASGHALELKTVSGREAKAANAAPANTADKAQFLWVKLLRRSRRRDPHSNPADLR